MDSVTAGRRRLLERLGEANAAFARRYPGERPDRQPVHTVYGGAHLFRATSAERLGAIALRFLQEYAPEPARLTAAVGWEVAEGLARTVYERVREKLEREPVEDFRIDFEDGYGNRPDAEEDETARAAAAEVARGLARGTLPPFLGIRIKPLGPELAERALRTLDLFLEGLCTERDARLPPGFVVTLPKVVLPEQVATLAAAFDDLEARLPIDPGSLKLEIMVETPQSILAEDGTVPLLDLVGAGGDRCVAAHFGVYDYTAALSITAEHQLLRHPACDRARGILQAALAGTGVWLSDGATNLLPVPFHRPEGDGTLAPERVEENRRSVHRGWRLHFEDVRHSLANAYYQGWDLHPAQLVTRYAAVYSFFLESLEAASRRLKRFVERAAQASLSRDVMDDAATGQALLNFFLRGLNCGAITEEEALATGLTLEELQSRSFLAILRGRGTTASPV